MKKLTLGIQDLILMLYRKEDHSNQEGTDLVVKPPAFGTRM